VNAHARGTRAQRALIEQYWGTGRVLATFSPVEQVKEKDLEAIGAREMAGASPGAVVRL
jgi:hypothetical protein